MNGALELITPGIGLPDAEARLVLGLAYVIAQVKGGTTDFEIIPEGNRYRLHIKGQISEIEIEESFKGLLKRVLSVKELYEQRLPGFPIARGKKSGFNPEKLVDVGAKVKNVLGCYIEKNLLKRAESKKDTACGHEDNKDNIFTLHLGLSPLVSKIPLPKFGASRYNIGICGVCLCLIVLGTYAASLRFRGDSYLVATFIPNQPTSSKELNLYFSAQKEIAGRYERFIGNLPRIAYPFALLAMYPHLVKVLQKGSLIIVLMEGGLSWQTRDVGTADIESAAKFFGFTNKRDSKSSSEESPRDPYRLWLVNRLLDVYKSDRTKEQAQKVQALWGTIAQIAKERSVNERRRLTLILLREIVSIFYDSYDLSKISWGLAKSLAGRDVMNIQEIIEKESIRKLAGILRELTFRKSDGDESRNYWYVDQLRDALSSDSKRVLDVFYNMLYRAGREYYAIKRGEGKLESEKEQLISSQKEPSSAEERRDVGAKLLSFNEQQLAEIVELLNKSDESRSATIAAIGLLTLCGYVPIASEERIEIGEESPFTNKSVGRFAALMRVFIEGDNKRFEFIDRIAGAKYVNEVLPVLFRLLRQAWVEKSKEETEQAELKKMFLPNEVDLKETLDYLEKEFSATKWALVLRALCYPKKIEQIEQYEQNKGG